MRKKFTCVDGLVRREYDQHADNVSVQVEQSNVYALEHPPVHHGSGQLNHPWMRHFHGPQNPT